MKNVTISFALAIALSSLAACDRAGSKSAAPVPAPAEDVMVQPSNATVAQTSSIDWEAARQDLSQRPAADIEKFQVAAGGEAPPVPLLLPGADSFGVASEGANAPRIQPLTDGYFANFPGEKYNIIVSGSNRVALAPGAAPPAARPADLVFTADPPGGRVTFSRYGADYMIEFECNDAGGDDVCITEAEALDYARKISIAGTR
jgi:predicted small lipoprotein YifL